MENLKLLIKIQIVSLSNTLKLECLCPWHLFACNCLSDGIHLKFTLCDLENQISRSSPIYHLPNNNECRGSLM